MKAFKRLGPLLLVAIIAAVAYMMYRRRAAVPSSAAAQALTGSGASAAPAASSASVSTGGGGLSNRDYVRQLYIKYLGRDPTGADGHKPQAANQWEPWITMLEAGQYTRETLADRIRTSTEGLTYAQTGRVNPDFV